MGRVRGKVEAKFFKALIVACVNGKRLASEELYAVSLQSTAYVHALRQLTPPPCSTLHFNRPPRLGNNTPRCFLQSCLGVACCRRRCATTSSRSARNGRLAGDEPTPCSWGSITRTRLVHWGRGQSYRSSRTHALCSTLRASPPSTVGRIPTNKPTLLFAPASNSRSVFISSLVGHVSCPLAMADGAARCLIKHAAPALTKHAVSSLTSAIRCAHGPAANG